MYYLQLSMDKFKSFTNRKVLHAGIENKILFKRLLIEFFNDVNKIFLKYFAY